MKCKLVKLLNFSGEKASIYAIILNDDNQTLFDKFVNENKNLFLSEINDIIIRLQTIGHKTGARENFFKIHEGSPGDGVCALYDSPNKKLRLYCIRYANQIVIVGSGGPKNVRALQEDKNLKKENYFLRWLSKQITERLKDGEIEYINADLDFSGDLNFQEDEEE